MKSQLEHGQPMEQTRGLFFTCHKGVARCQSKHQYHFWQMNSMFGAYCKGNLQVSLAATNQICALHKAMNGCKNLRFIKGLLEDVNISLCTCLTHKSLASILWDMDKHRRTRSDDARSVLMYLLKCELNCKLLPKNLNLKWIRLNDKAGKFHKAEMGLV